MKNIVDLIKVLDGKDSTFNTFKTDTEANKIPQIDTNKTDIVTLNEKYDNLTKKIVADINGTYSINDFATYILTLNGNTTINLNIPQNTEIKVIIKQTSAYTVTFTGCTFASDPTISFTSGEFDTFRFENYGKIRGYHVDQY